MGNILFKPQKVLSLDKALSLKNPKIFGEYIITTKFEGWYTTIYYDGQKFHAPLSSNSRVIPAFQWVAEHLNRTKYYIGRAPFVIIAEAYLLSTPFEILNGIFNRSKGDCSCMEVVFKVHDIVLFADRRIASVRLIDTYKTVMDINSPLLHYVEPLLISEFDSKLWGVQFDKVANAGGEGIVAKRADSYYQQGKRNADLLKIKLECTRDLLAVALEEGIGEKGNPSLTLVSERSNGTLIRTVISKHSDQARFRTNPDCVIGKVVQVKAMQEYPDMQLRQPVFQYLRPDKLISEID
jgi:hypothetical protein